MLSLYRSSSYSLFSFMLNLSHSSLSHSSSFSKYIKIPFISLTLSCFIPICSFLLFYIHLKASLCHISTVTSVKNVSPFSADSQCQQIHYGWSLTSALCVTHMIKWFDNSSQTKSEVHVQQKITLYALTPPPPFTSWFQTMPCCAVLLFWGKKGSAKAVWRICLATASYWPESYLAQPWPISSPLLGSLAAFSKPQLPKSQKRETQ